MTTRLRWEIGDRLSPLHAARCWAGGLPGIDSQLIRAIAEPMTQLTERLAADEVNLEAFWRCLLTHVAANHPAADDRDSCRAALAAAGVGELTLDGVTSAVHSRIAEIRLAFQDRFPKLAQQLSLRGRPLREQWEAYGPGLLRFVGKQTHEAFLPKTVTALLLSPYRGGDGDCDSASATLWIEAVLTNPIPEIPEVLRLTWLVSRIGLERECMPHPLPADKDTSDPSSAIRRTDVIGLALIPIVLQSAVELELLAPLESPPDRIATAVAAWSGHAETNVVEILHDWWNQTRQLQPAFPVSLKALDRMLPGSPSLHLGASP
jgi:hypothetical protein